MHKRLLRHPVRLAWYLIHTRFAHFFLVGATGVLINLGLTAFFAELMLGRENYFSAFLIGIAANILYNFTLHTLVTFKTERHHTLRLGGFVAYSLGLAYVQARTVQWITDRVGVDWYLVVIASVIGVFSIGTFLLFKFGLFKNFGTGAGRGGEAEV